MSKKPARTPRSRPSAIVRAEHGGRPVALTTAERGVLKDALREGTDRSFGPDSRRPRRGGA